MRTWSKMVAVAVLAFASGGLAAQAATQSAFERITNDGVFTLTTAQQVYSTTTATRIGFLRARAVPKGVIAEGTTFDAATVASRCAKECSMLGTILNGKQGSLLYSGSYLSALGTTKVWEAGGEFYGAVAFLFGDGANVTFAGTRGTTATYNAGQTRGDLDFAVPAPVPLPAAGWLLVAGIGGLVAMRRRRVAAA